MPLDPGTGTPLDNERARHASGEWELLVKTLRRKLPRDLQRTRDARRWIRRGR